MGCHKGKNGGVRDIEKYLLQHHLLVSSENTNVFWQNIETGRGVVFFSLSKPVFHLTQEQDEVDHVDPYFNKF